MLKVTGVLRLAGKWLPQIDLMRGMAIVAVVMIHVTTAYTLLTGSSPLVIANILLNTLSGYAVPLFVLISGIVLANSYWERYDLKQFYVRRMKSIVPQYMFFTLFFIIFRVLFLAAPLTIILFVYGFGTASGYYHMWFFALIIQLYLIYPILEKIYRWSERRNVEVYLVVGSLLVQIFYSYLWTALINMTGSWHYTYILNNMLDRLFPLYLFYFVLGIYAIRNIDRVKSWIHKLNTRLIAALILALGSILSIHIILDRMNESMSVIDLFYQLKPSIIMVVLSFVLAYRLSQQLIDRRGIWFLGLEELGKYSYGIFLIHPFFLMLIIRGLAQISITTSQWYYYPIAFVITMGISYLTVMLFSYLPWSQYIVGTHNSVKTGGKPITGSHHQ